MPDRNTRRYLKQGTLPQLGVFEAIVRHGNYTRAAEELYMAQPTVSIQMKKLAETVGLPLLEQIGKQVHPTEGGKAVLRACEGIFAAIDALDQELANLRGVTGGRLRLAVSTTGKYFAPRLLAEFARQYPGVDLSMEIHNRKVLIERLQANEDDLYIFANPPEEMDVVKQSILPNPMVIFARTDHPLAKRRKIPLDALARENFIAREPGSGTRLVMQRYFEKHAFDPQIRMELSTNEAVKQAIIAGLGVSIMSRYTLGLDTEQPQLTTLDVEGFPLEGNWYLVYALGKQLSPVARAFLELVRREAGNLVLDHLTSGG